MKALITGANGQVAFELQRYAGERTITALTKEQLDITHPDTLIQSIRPDVVINTAAYTKVDDAEKNPELAFAVNRDGAKNLAIACEKMQCPLIHLSTDYVFDGQKQTPYLEEDLVMPLSIYGKSKWEGEEAVRDHCEKHIIIRTSGVFGVQGNNFVKTMLRLAKQNLKPRVINDQITCPTPASDIAKMLWQVCEKLTSVHEWGTYHFCATPAVSWYEFASNIIDAVESIPTTDYPLPATRPKYSVLDCQKIKKIFNIQQPNWQKGLKDVVDELSTT